MHPDVPAPGPLDRARRYPYPRPAGSFAFDPADGAISPLGAHDRLPADRVPVLAVGSNAAPEQLRRKPITGPPIPVLAVTLADHDAVFAAAVASYGAVPATVLASPGTVLHTHVLLLTDAQKATLDGTEGVPTSYEHLELAPHLVVSPVELGGPVTTYRATAGALAIDGVPRALAALAATGRRWPAWTEDDALAWVAGRCGCTVAELVDRAEHQAARAEIRRALRDHATA